MRTALAHAVVVAQTTFNPDGTGMPGRALFDNVGNWIMYAAVGVVVMSIFAGAMQYMAGSISHNSRASGSGLGIAVKGVMAAIVIGAAGALVRYGLGTDLGLGA